VFDARYRNDETGASAYHPGVLLKVVLLGYARGLTSSRSIERAWPKHMQFVWKIGVELNWSKPDVSVFRQVTHLRWQQNQRPAPADHRDESPNRQPRRAITVQPAPRHRRTGLRQSAQSPSTTIHAQNPTQGRCTVEAVCLGAQRTKAARQGAMKHLAKLETVGYPPTRSCHRRGQPHNGVVR